MVKIILDIDEMACGMCESHINEALRRQFSVKKVTSSHTKGQTEILSEQPLDENTLKTTIEATGCKVTGFHTEPLTKRGFPLFSMDKA